MPSWEIHRKWGELILGFSSPEIDKLIDQEERHDASRYDPVVFEKQVEDVRARYGEKGVNYYILHHLLDYAEQRLLSILSDEAIKKYYHSDRSSHEAVKEVEHKLRQNLLRFQSKHPHFPLESTDSLAEKLTDLLQLIYDIMDGEHFPRRFGGVTYMKALRKSKHRWVVDEEEAKKITDIGIEHIAEIFGILAEKKKN